MPSTRSSVPHPHYRTPPRVPGTIINDYIRAVAEHFGTSPNKLLSQRLSGGGLPGSQPIQRQIAIYLLRKGTGIHLDLLARRFDRSRTTIIRSIALVERKLASRTHAYLTAVQSIGELLQKRGISGDCDRCGISCTPGPLCWECEESTGLGGGLNGAQVNGHSGNGKRVLTNGHTKTKFRSDRSDGAGRTETPPGRKAAGPNKASPRRGGL